MMRKTYVSCLLALLIVQVQVKTVWATKLWKDVCTQSDTEELPFCNASLPILERVEDYVGRIPVKHQVKMMGHVAAPFEPLHIPQYQWWNEGLHGPLQPCVTGTTTTATVTSSDTASNTDRNEAKTKCACPTSFPCPSALGTAYNRSLYQLIGKATGLQGRAISQLREHATGQRGDGINYWSPTINMQRDPRWGRNQEVPGEDPFLTGQYAKHFVNGLQGPNKDKLQIAACCKHYAVNSLEQWKQYTRHDFDAKVTMPDLFNYYLPPFKTCAQYAVGVMCSINAVNGVPVCVDQFLMKTILRDQLKFDGYVTTDCSSIKDAVIGHKYANNAQEAVAMAINATTDLNCGHYPFDYPAALGMALDEQLVQAKTIQASFARLVRVQMQLGLFDNNIDNDNHDIHSATSTGSPIDVIDSPEQRQLAYEAALQSIVLLQNKNSALPLSGPPFASADKQETNDNTNLSLAVIGPHTHGTGVFLSNYHGDRCCGGGSDCVQTPFDAFKEANQRGTTRAVIGCEVNSTLNQIDHAVALAKQSDAIVLLMGLDTSIEREEQDRTETTLPGLQVDLINAILELGNPRTILVLINGGAVSLGHDIIERTPAIVDAFYGGQEASRALVDVLFGNYNPTAKLAATIYPPEYVDTIPLTEMGLTVGPGRTHIYYKGTPEFSFGHGLSYSDWELHWHGEEGDLDVVDKEWIMYGEGDGRGESVTCQLNVRNVGPHVGSQTVLLFWRPLEVPGADIDVRQKLIDFAGTNSLEVGQEETLTFQLKLQDFAIWDIGESPPDFVVSEGLYEVVAQATNNAELSRRLVVRGTSDSSKVTAS